MDTSKQTKQEKMDTLDTVEIKDKIDSLGDMEQWINKYDELKDIFDPSVYCCFNVKDRKIIYNIEK